MKVKCTQCGKIFKVPDSQAQRSLKCVCKNIFLAVPLPEEIEAIQLQAEDASSPPTPPPNQVSHLGHFEDPPSSPSEEPTEEGLAEYVAFLRQSRVVKKEEAETLAPPSVKPLESFELAAPIKAPPEPAPTPPPVDKKFANEVSPLGKDAAGESPVVEKKKTQAPSISSPKKKEVFSERKPKQPSINKKAVGLTLAGAVGLFIVISAILTPQKRTEETMDPYLSKLLTPTAYISPSLPPLVHKTSSTHRPIVKFEVEKTEPETITTEEIVESPLLLKLREAAFEGNFENVVRLASANSQLGDEEKALLYEALFERGGKQSERHRELVEKLDAERKSFPNSGALLRATAFSILNNPSTERNLSRALEILKSLSLTRPRDALVFTYLGMAYEAMDRMDLAHRAWDSALSIQPNYARLLINRDELYRSEKDFPSALEMATKLSKLQGHELEGLKRMAEVYELKEDFNSAVAVYRKAMKLEDSPDLHLAVGDLLLETNPDGAIREYEAGLKVHPSRNEKRDLYLRIAKTHCGRGNYTGASIAFKKAVSEDMHSVKIAIEKARCELSSKSFRAASATLEDALKLSPNNYQLWQDYGFALYRQDKHRAAHSALKHAIELKATDQGYYLIAQVLVSLHKEAEAGVYLKKALQLNPNHREARVLLRSLN